MTMCDRCGREATGAKGDESARMLRRAEHGECGECAVVLFIQSLNNMHGGHMIGDPKALLLPHVQEQFAAVMLAGMAEMKPDEIDWERVVQLWDIAPASANTLF